MKMTLIDAIKYDLSRSRMIYVSHAGWSQFCVPIIVNDSAYIDIAGRLQRIRSYRTMEYSGCRHYLLDEQKSALN